MPGLRWVPVPLAALAAVIGVLVMGSFQGQAAQANAHQTGYRAGGLALTVETMYWMSNDMTGQGPTAKSSPAEFHMPASQMPGIQPVGDDRLQVEVDLSNYTTDVQRYSMSDFTLVGAKGKTWKVVPQGLSLYAAAANLEPGFESTVTIYFDIQGQYSKHLTLEWSRGGTKVSIPVTIGGASMAGMHM